MAFWKSNFLSSAILFMMTFWCSRNMRTTGLSTDVCIDVGEEEMTCTREVLETRTLYDNESINVGVTQRIDGSDAEKQAIRDVLKHMDHYFFNEVLALPEYEYARSRWYEELDCLAKVGTETRVFNKLPNIFCALLSLYRKMILIFILFMQLSNSDLQQKFE